MSEKQEFEKYPALTEIIQHFACHVPVRLDEWTTLLVEINNALEAASQPPAIDLEKIPFDPNRLKQMEGHEERAEKSWGEIQKRLAQPPAVKGADPEELTVQDYIEVLEDHKRLVRELDTIINGPNAAKQASLCDIVGQLANEWKRPTGAVWVKASYRLPLTHGPYCIQFNNEYCTGRFQAEMKRFILPDGSTPSLAFIEWLDANIGAQMPDSTTRVYDLELVLYRLMKVFEKTQRTGLQEKRYKEATDVLNKNFNPASVLRDECPTAAADGKEAIEFADWAMNNFGIARDSSWKKIWAGPGPKQYTTAELYDYYLTDKNK